MYRKLFLANRRVWVGASLLIGLLSSASMANATTINVLWTSGTNTYNSNVSSLAQGASQDAASYDPKNDGSLSWNIDFWNTGSVDFSLYDVLVVGSTCFGGFGSNCNSTSGFFNLGVLPQNNILTAKTELENARGTRTFVSGQDADWHFMNDSSSSDRMAARAFLINAVNWAASGSGLGIVALADGHTSGGSAASGWLSNASSFLASDLSSSRRVGDSNNVLIPSGSADFPVNEGLTSSALSGWGTSSHTYFNKSFLDPAKWLSINDFSILGGDNAVTIVTASTADGDTDGGNDDTPSGNAVSVSSPSSIGILLFAMAFVGNFFRSRVTL